MSVAKPDQHAWYSIHRRSRRRLLGAAAGPDRKSTRLNSSHGYISYAVFCLKKKKKNYKTFGYATAISELYPLRRAARRCLLEILGCVHRSVAMIHFVHHTVHVYGPGLLSRR